jgi:hypothetical protein
MVSTRKHPISTDSRIDVILKHVAISCIERLLTLQPLYRSFPHVTLMSRPSTSSPADISQQPVTRSRTLFYLSIRDSITPTHNRGTIKTGQYGDTLDIADNEEEERLIEGTGRGKGLPPKW